MIQKNSTRQILVLLTLMFIPLVALSDDLNTREIDEQIWGVVSKTVIEHNIEGMAAIYHPEAVLVTGNGAGPIGPQMVKWGEGMQLMRRAGVSAAVSFRFSARQGDETTAFETGIFRYSTTDASGVENASYVHLEALLIKRDGNWLILMERQLEAADQTSWEALH
jgi:hypothetical protein